MAVRVKELGRVGENAGHLLVHEAGDVHGEIGNQIVVLNVVVDMLGPVRRLRLPLPFRDQSLEPGLEAGVYNELGRMTVIRMAVPRCGGQNDARLKGTQIGDEQPLVGFGIFEKAVPHARIDALGNA